MAELADRLLKRKRITKSGQTSTFVDVPVIYEMKLKTLAEQAQDYWIYLNNSSTSSRKVHTKRIANNLDNTQFVDVERIEEINIKTLAEQAQERVFVLTNNDPPPLTFNDGVPNTSIMHERVHYVRYFKDNDEGSNTWVDVELIDELKIKDTVSQAQEWIYYLRHPELGDVINDPDVPYIVTVGYCNPALELAPPENDIDPPFRLDMFQNIVNVNWEEDNYLQTQYFVFCRSPNSFYPVTEEFVQQQLTDNNTNVKTLEEIRGVEARQLLSDLIQRAMSRSDDHPPNDPYQSWGSYWGRISTGTAAYWELIQPNNLNPYGYYNNDPNQGTFHYVYIFYAGYYYEDDMGTGDWPPPFEPPP